VARPSRASIGVGLLVAALAGALWLWRAVLARESPPALTDPSARALSRGAAREAASSPPSSPPSAARASALPGPAEAEGPPPSPIVAVRAPPMALAEPQHLMDPCADVTEPPAPAGFETLAAQGITVAWPPSLPAAGPSDPPVRPLSLAHLVTGLLEEAAQTTGTPRRAELTVVVYPSADDFRASTKAPSWAAGLYDGAVRLPADPRFELGVSLSTLRHEVMHAQLHAAVGCMPVWFNEGAAMYFAGAAPAREWIELLRAPAPLELALLEAPVLDERAAPRADRVYAQSLAMILFDVERAGGAGLAPAVLALSDANRASPREGLALWSRLHPGVDHAPVLEALARRIFGAPPGDLGAILDGPLCCHGLLRAAELTCRATAARPGRTAWIDETSSPRASCRARW
jgi:hypothetical protein